MPGPKIPYPPSPNRVPDNFTDYPDSYRSQQRLLLVGLFLFLTFYIGLIVLSVLVGVLCFLTRDDLWFLKVVGMVLSGTFLLYLVKGFFKRHPVEKELQVEITEEEQPVLFGFIDKLCDELGAPEPNRVFLTLDVNAAVRPETSLINLIVEPKKDLIIGLGLVNACNLSEFKSVMAHEFGHFCQSGYTSSYSYVASMIIIDLVAGEDWFDRFVNWLKRQESAVALLGHFLGFFLWVGRKILGWVLDGITRQRLAVMREQEFHADLVAVKAAGSDAVVLSLMRLRFGNLCLMQAMNDLRSAADHKLYTRDLFYHQERAEPVVRRLRKDPKLGLRPDSPDPLSGKYTCIFDPEEEELEHEEIPEMRRTHPPAHETEENAKATFIVGVVDDRTPWELFAGADDLKERLTYKFYRRAFRVPRDADLADPAAVQKFIDNEHADTTYDPKYAGIYDDRVIEPGDLDELDTKLRSSPWPADRVEDVYRKMYAGGRSRAEEYSDLQKEKAALENTPGPPSPRRKKKVRRVEEDMERAWEWFQSLDRKVYQVHVQMAAAVNPAWRDDLVERYRFQLEVQRMFQDSRYHQGRAAAFVNFLFGQPQNQVSGELVADVMDVLRDARRALKKILESAREINLPAMRNFEEGDRLADFILGEKLISELPFTYFKTTWVEKLLTQLGKVRERCFRLHFKSLGGILAHQEKIAAAWLEMRTPVEAEVVVVAAVAGAAPVAVVEATLSPTSQVLDAELIVADLAPLEPLNAEPLDAELIVAELIPEPVRADEHAAVAVTAARSAPPPPPVLPPPLAGPPHPVAAPLPDTVIRPVPAVLAAEPPAPPPPAAPAEPPPPAAPEPVFELPPVDEPAPAPSASHTSLPAEEVFSLDADAPQYQEKPAALTVTKPASASRPAFTITFVRPGERSPLGAQK